MVALREGINPLLYLYADPFEAKVLLAIAKKAQEARIAEKDSEIKSIGVAVGNAVGVILAKAFSR